MITEEAVSKERSDKADDGDSNGESGRDQSRERDEEREQRQRQRQRRHTASRVMSYSSLIMLEATNSFLGYCIPCIQDGFSDIGPQRCLHSGR